MFYFYSPCSISTFHFCHPLFLRYGCCLTNSIIWMPLNCSIRLYYSLYSNKTQPESMTITKTWVHDHYCHYKNSPKTKQFTTVSHLLLITWQEVTLKNQVKKSVTINILYPNAYRFTKCLCQCFGFPHFQRKYFTTSHCCEGRVSSKGLSDTF